MKTTTSILFFRPTQECLETLNTSTPSYEKKVKPLGGTWVIHENGTVSSMDNPKTRCEEQESEVSCTDPTHLKNLGVGTQILLPHGDLQVGELMDQRGTASSSAEVPPCWPSGKKPPRTEGKDETMEAASTYG